MESKGPTRTVTPGKNKEKGTVNTAPNNVNNVSVNDRIYVNNEYLNCFFINTRSILNNLKVDELQLLADMYKLDVIGVCESWLHSGVSDSEVNLKGFRLYRRDRGEGRGVGFYCILRIVCLPVYVQILTIMYVSLFFV